MPHKINMKNGPELSMINLFKPLGSCVNNLMRATTVNLAIIIMILMSENLALFAI